MHDHAAGLDAQIVNLAGPGLQIVIDGVGNIDRVGRGRAVGHQFQLGCMHRSVADEALPIGADLRGNVGQHGNALVRLNHAGSDRIEVLQGLSVALSGVSEASLGLTGPAVPFMSSSPPPGSVAESVKGKDLAKENWSTDRFSLL